MQMQRGFKFSLITITLLIGLSIYAQATIIDFEGLPEFTQVTNQYSALGVTFSGITVSNGVPTILTAGTSLNELDFPPYSGVNVAFDDSGPIIAYFSPFSIMVGAFFTYTVPITITAYDILNNVVGTATSLYVENYVSSSNPFPNEFLSINYAPGISRLEILGDSLGGSFVMDDFTFEPIPEPSTILLLGSGLAGMVVFIKKKRSKRLS